MKFDRHTRPTRTMRRLATAVKAATAVAVIAITTAAAPTPASATGVIPEYEPAANSVLTFQSLTVSSDVQTVEITRDSYEVIAPPPPPPASPAIASSQAARDAIVQTAMTYLGVQYVLGGSSHAGIDCSGLTKRAYEAVGIDLFHYVPTQNAAGVTIPASEALPGDLVVFDNNAHVGIYLGGTSIIHAPAPGQAVKISNSMFVSSYHFVRILND